MKSLKNLNLKFVFSIIAPTTVIIVAVIGLIRIHSQHVAKQQLTTEQISLSRDKIESLYTERSELMREWLKKDPHPQANLHALKEAKRILGLLDRSDRAPLKTLTDFQRFDIMQNQISSYFSETLARPDRNGHLSNNYLELEDVEHRINLARAHYQALAEVLSGTTTPTFKADALLARSHHLNPNRSSD